MVHKYKARDRIELSLDVIKNLPRALYETTCAVAVVGGASVATVGGLVSLVNGNLESAGKCLLVGSSCFTCGFGFAIPLAYSYDDECGICNIFDAIDWYNQKKKGKVDLGTLKMAYPNRDYEDL